MCLGSDMIPIQKIEESINRLPSLSPDVDVGSTIDKQERYKLIAVTLKIRIPKDLT